MLECKRNVKLVLNRRKMSSQRIRFNILQYYLKLNYFALYHTITNKKKKNSKKCDDSVQISVQINIYITAFIFRASMKYWSVIIIEQRLCFKTRKSSRLKKVTSLDYFSVDSYTYRQYWFCQQGLLTVVSVATIGTNKYSLRLVSK